MHWRAQPTGHVKRFGKNSGKLFAADLRGLLNDIRIYFNNEI